MQRKTTNTGALIDIVAANSDMATAPSQAADAPSVVPHGRPEEPSGVLYGCGTGPHANGVLAVDPQSLDGDGDCRHFARIDMSARESGHDAPRMVAVACETSVAVARDVNGGLWVWGRGVGTDRPTLLRSVVAKGRCVSCAAAAGFAVAVLDSGDVLCVGDNAPGTELRVVEATAQQGKDTASRARMSHGKRESTPRSAGARIRITRLQLDLASATCQGSLGYEEVKEEPVTAKEGDTEASDATVAPPHPVGVDASGRTVLVRTDDGALWACGDPVTSGLGGKTHTSVLRAVHNEAAKAMRGVVAFSVGSLHAAAVLENGSVWVWGNGISGNHGIGKRVKHIERPRRAPGFGTDRDNPIAVSVGCTKGSPNPKQIRTKAGWIPGQEGPRLHVVDSCGALWIAGTTHKGLAADHLYKTLSPKVDHLAFYRVGGPAVVDEGAPKAFIGAAEMLLRDPAVAARRMGMASHTDFGKGARRTTGYLSAVRVAESYPAHIHSVALTTDGQLFTWGCGSNGRCGLDAIVQKHGGKKRNMKCYVHCPSSVETLEGRRVVSVAVGKWWTFAIVDED